MEEYLAAEQPAEEEAEEAEEEPGVTITSDQRDVMEEGEIVTLTSELKGFEKYDELLLIWEVDRGDGWVELEKSINQQSWSFPATAESLTWNWRLSVYYR